MTLEDPIQLKDLPLESCCDNVQGHLFIHKTEIQLVRRKVVASTFLF